ncbi:hypothetical protein Ndes2437B_g05784 [Nannochloris sp. 'desiccata']
MFAKLVGEGYERPNAENELPLDVNYAKVSDWLVDRRLVAQDWTRKLHVIQAKAADAVKELPPGFLGQFNGGEDVPIDYYMAKEILNELIETADRGLLGSLKGSAGTWERIVKAYESNLFQAAEDLEKRSAECLKSAVVAANDFQQELESTGIPAGSFGTSNTIPGLKKALTALTAQLPGLMGTAVESVKAQGVGDACTYYAAFINTMLSSDSKSSKSKQELVTLNEVREGRTEAPKEINLPVGESNSCGGGIDWGVEEANDVAPGDVQWDIGVEDTDAATGGSGDAGGISWDFETIAVETGDSGAAGIISDGGGAGGDATGAAGISWDIDISLSGTGEETAVAGGGTDASSSDQTLTAAAVGTNDRSNGGIFEINASPEISRLIVDGGYRAKLLDDLHELRAFLKARVNELASENQSLLASAPSEISSVDKAAAASMQSSVDSAITALTEPRTLQLVSLATSAVYCDRLASALARQGGQEGKFRKAAADADARKIEVQRQLVSDSAKLASLVRRTRKVKTGVEAALSAKLSRKVNIQGEINAVLS